MRGPKEHAPSLPPKAPAYLCVAVSHFLPSFRRPNLSLDIFLRFAATGLPSEMPASADQDRLKLSALYSLGHPMALTPSLRRPLSLSLCK